MTTTCRSLLYTTPTGMPLRTVSNTTTSEPYENCFHPAYTMLTDIYDGLETHCPQLWASISLLLAQARPLMIIICLIYFILLSSQTLAAIYHLFSSPGCDLCKPVIIASYKHHRKYMTNTTVAQPDMHIPSVHAALHALNTYVLVLREPIQFCSVIHGTLTLRCLTGTLCMSKETATTHTNAWVIWCSAIYQHLQFAGLWQCLSSVHQQQRAEISI